MHSLFNWRKSRGLSQEAVAGFLGIDRSAYSRIESGERRLLASELALLRREGMTEADALQIANEAAGIVPILTPEDEVLTPSDTVTAA